MPAVERLGNSTAAEPHYFNRPASIGDLARSRGGLKWMVIRARFGAGARRWEKMLPESLRRPQLSPGFRDSAVRGVSLSAAHTVGQWRGDKCSWHTGIPRAESGRARFEVHARRAHTDSEGRTTLVNGGRRARFPFLVSRSVLRAASRPSLATAGRRLRGFDRGF